MIPLFSGGGKIATYSDMLSCSDLELLEEYIPKLFNTIELPDKNLSPVILILTGLIISYRRAQMEKDAFEQTRFKDFDSIKKQETKPKRIKDIRKKIKEIFYLVGAPKSEDEKELLFKKSDDVKLLIKVLEQLYRNPEEFFLENPKYTISKKPIENWLTSLKLKKKTNVIKKFMKSI
jgi:hypothetical protein